MLKKILIGFLILIGGFYSDLNIVSAGENDNEHANEFDGVDKNGTVTSKKCSGSGCISSTDFMISVNDFNVGGGKIGGVDITTGNSTEETMGTLLSVIIKNLIVIFGVLSLLTMTIGGGYMIFHSGDDSLLSRGKSIFMYGIISLAVALSAGLMVQLVTYILY